MKTFETEKGSIPEGATHTHDYGGNECGYYKVVDGNWFYWGWSEAWCVVVDNQCFYEAIPIQQTNMETPEEKVAEWVNGDELDLLTPGDKWCACEHLFIGENSGGYPVIEHKATGNMFETYWGVIRKPETPQQHEERERLEAAYDLYCVWVGDRAGHHAIDFNEWKVIPDYYKKWLRIVDKTNYRKEG